MSAAGPSPEPGASSGVAAGVTPGALMILAAVTRWQAGGSGRLVIAIDGHGAAGKTTLAEAVACVTGAQLLHTDDYLHPARGADDTRPMAQYYDWERLRQEAILPALYTAPDSGSGASSGTGSGTSPLLIEGVSSASPALADLVTHAIYVDTAEPTRIERLQTRIRPDEWDEDWLEAERGYFAVRPPRSFDLIVPGA